MRDMIHDSKIRQRNFILAVLKESVAVPALRTRVATPAFADLLSSSIIKKPDFETVSFSSASSGPATDSATPPASGSPAPAAVIPQATPVRVNKKARAEAEEMLRSQPESQLFTDPDWMLDAAIEDAAENLVLLVEEARINATINKMDKLLAKLIF
jgi:hypothetical protein